MQDSPSHTQCAAMPRGAGDMLTLQGQTRGQQAGEQGVAGRQRCHEGRGDAAALLRSLGRLRHTEGQDALRLLRQVPKEAPTPFHAQRTQQQRVGWRCTNMFVKLACLTVPVGCSMMRIFTAAYMLTGTLLLLIYPHDWTFQSAVASLFMRFSTWNLWGRENLATRQPGWSPPLRRPAGPARGTPLQPRAARRRPGRCP